jgi:predicted phage terminase large subunit-like protein
MPMRMSPFFVPKKTADEVLEEIQLKAAAKQQKTARRFNPLLGSTAEEADERLAAMRADINQYGEYVYGHAPAPVHRFWNQAVDDVINRRVRQNKILILAPPNSAKSTWNSLIRTTHYLGNHPDQHLIFLTSSDDMAKTFASTVRGMLAESEKHAEVFSALECRPHKVRGWSGDGLYLRGTPIGDKDPAYKAVGWGMTIMGARANGAILDDVLDQKTAESEAEQIKARSYYDKTIVPRLNTHNGWLVAVMTRYAEGDLGGHFLKLSEEGGDWLVVRTPLEADEDDPMGRAPGESLWPEQFSPEFIAATRKRLSVAEYDLIYNLDTTGTGGDIFTSEAYFKDLPANFWSEIEPTCFVMQAVDLAFSSSKRSCFSVIMTLAVDPQFRMYILHIDRKHYQIRDSEERIKELIRLTKPVISVIETENFHDQMIRGMVLRIMHEVMANIQLEKPTTDKIMRARLPAGRAEHGMIFVDRNAPWFRTFISEVLGFPNRKLKDQVDTLSLAALTVQKMEENQARYTQRAVRRPQVQHVMSA